MKKKEIIEIQEEVSFMQDGKKIILEKGDKIQILESMQTSCGYFKIAASTGTYTGGVTVEISDYRRSNGGRVFSFFDENHKLLVDCVVDLSRLNN